jgi:Terminase RNaseH-like domain
MSGRPVGTESPHIPEAGICGPLTASQDEGDDGTGAEREPSDEEIKELIDFISQETEAEAPQTAREKRLAKRREKIEDQLAFLSRWGKLLDSTKRNCPIVEGGRTYRVAPREFLMRERLKIRNKRGRLESLKVNAVQRDYAEKAGKRSIVLKARQLGITTYVAARFFLNCITRPGTMCVQVAHDQRSAEEIFRIVHRLLANMPEVLRKGALATSHANKRQIIFPHLDSQYRVEAADENAGRGLTIQYLHCSEVSRWPGDAEATLAALRAAVPPDGEIVLESTANGAAGCFYEEWQRAEQMGYSRHFYPWWWEPSYKREVDPALPPKEGGRTGHPAIVEFTEDELELMQKYELTAEQIGFRREMKANFGRHAKEEFAEDAESCFLASGDCIFDVDVIEQRLHDELPVMAQSDGGRAITFFPPQPGKEYIIGVDPAGGGSEGDYSCAQVIDRASGMQVAELRGHLTPEETAARVAILARQYNKALVAVERNNHGHAVLGYLSMVHADVQRYHVKGTEGWLTSAATRPMMLRNLGEVLAAAPQLFNSTRLLEECKTFVRRPDGTTAAANGAHDDTVMAMAVALAVRAEAIGQFSPGKTEVEVGVL